LSRRGRSSQTGREVDVVHRDERVTLERVARPRRALAFAGVVVAVAVLAFGSGWLVRSPTQSVVDAQSAVVLVDATVELRAVGASVRITGEVADVPATSVIVTSVPGANAAVVTSVGVQVGSEVASGTLIGTVSGRPIFAMLLSIPLYRDLVTGDTGPDVVSLQGALGVPATGKMDRTTIAAFRAMYERVGIAAPGAPRTYVSAQEIAAIPPSTYPIVVRQIASVGATLSAEEPLALIGADLRRIEMRVDVIEVESIEVGAAVSISAGAGDLEGVVASISEFQTALEDGMLPGFDVVVEVSDPLSALSAGQSVTVDFTAEQPEPGLAVPTVGIRSDRDGQYVLRVDGEETSRVDVSVLVQQDGWSQVSADALEAGDLIRLSP
jgi:hypothetical protein